MCVLIPQKYILKIIITFTSSYNDEIFHNDTQLISSYTMLIWIALLNQFVWLWHPSDHNDVIHCIVQYSNNY